MSLQSALLGYLISLLLPTPISPQENVVLQTTATATGTVSLTPRAPSCSSGAHELADAASCWLRRNPPGAVAARPGAGRLATARDHLGQRHPLVVRCCFLRVPNLLSV